MIHHLFQPPTQHQSLAGRAEAMNGIYSSGSHKSFTTTLTPLQTESASASTTSTLHFWDKGVASRPRPLGPAFRGRCWVSRVAVLYILQKTGSLDTTKSSEENIPGYLVDSYADATHPAEAAL